MPAPGPPALGRGVVVAGGPVPGAWAEAPVVRVDEEVLAAPAPTVAALHRAWAQRRPVVVDLAVDPARFRAPASEATEPWRLGGRFEIAFDRLHFLVWANTYDARDDSTDPVWWWARKAARLGAEGGGPADVVLPDGTPAWVDGGPRGPLGTGDGAAVVHRESVELGRLAAVPPEVAPTADLAPDQLAAVAAGAGAARIVAPAGSGKTRVLTERLRHLLVDRELEREAVLAVAYNKRAQLELETRTAAFRPRVSTLNALGLRLVAEARGGAPRVLEEREVRRLVERLVPTRQRRANTDPLAPYLEGLSAIRLGLRDPAEVEAERDDVPGLAEAFPAYRRALASAGAVDFDEQVYAAIEALLADGAFRRRAQEGCRHLLVDEFQDLTPAHLLLLRLLASPALDVFGVGDDDQCHPPGTLVATDAGPVPIEDLDPGRHSLLTWDRTSGTFVGGTPSPQAHPSEGHGFSVAGRRFEGDVLEVSVGSSTVAMTPEHRLLARWDEGLWEDPGATVVFLMRRGPWFRIGTCSLRHGVTFGPGSRMRHEAADAVWVLSVTDDPAEALVVEAVAAANFGLPMTPFGRSRGPTDHRTPAHLEKLFGAVEDMEGKADRLLRHFGRDLRFPFCSTGGAEGGRTAFDVRACNLVSGCMALPVPLDRRDVRWVAASVRRTPYSGPVYGLEVRPHHTYVAGGVVVKNCIYSYVGADPGFLLDFDELFPGAADHPLEVNYRCPEAVVAGARSLLGHNARRVDKVIRAGPTADPEPDALALRRHRPEEGASTLVGVVQGWLDEPGVVPAGLAVLTRVGSLLLGPHVALAEAGVPVASALGPEVLERTGVRAALAYLRIGARPDAVVGDDVAEVLRRPSRGLPGWFTKWLRPRMTIDSVRAIAERLDDARVADKVVDLATDLELVADAVRQGTTRSALLTVRDGVGLGTAMAQLDGSKGGQTASSLDDLEALLQVADLHPDAASFEPWLRAVLRRPVAGEGVTLSTVHRVKGMEWDRVAVFGVTAGIVPHRLAADVEEERRVLHVAVTRGRQAVVVLGDGSRPSPFLDELAGLAPRRPPAPVPAAGAAPAPARAAPVPVDEGLKAWRRARSSRDGVPAYVVATDEMLRDLAEARPTSLPALRRVRGMGPKRLELYGEELLALFAAAD